MMDSDAFDDKTTISLHQLAEEADNTSEKSIEYWETILKESKYSFQNSLDTIQETRERTIDLIKIDLILASIYIALLRFGTNGSQIAPNSFILALPFAPLLLSGIIFLHGYISLGPRTIGISSGNIHESLLQENNKYEYCKTMAIVYAKWTDKNIELNQKSMNHIMIGIGCIFTSLGAVAGIFVFY
ncbi:hypothetical protein ACFO5R_08740 [Halosolutus amylolyticus]|uniref:Uncharacterized protein n=1 Tax=Halosolutus amylolyticus TaxID=2932267 RepID=A0ABD5PPZ0_9EURY|nr:hypothetical protein [Halosolutus amylolyticus]